MRGILPVVGGCCSETVSCLLIWSAREVLRILLYTRPDEGQQIAGQVRLLLQGIEICAMALRTDPSINS